MVEIKYTCPNKLEKLTSGSSGFDIKANETCTIMPGYRALINTDLYLEIPEGYEGQIRPRSGLAIRVGLGVLNSPGTIDADYRGEIRIIAINLGQESIVIRPGDRIAQLIIQKVPEVIFIEADCRTNLSLTKRGENGFGSTGI